MIVVSRQLDHVCVYSREVLCEDEEQEEEDCEFKLLSDVDSLSGQVRPQQSSREFYSCLHFGMLDVSVGVHFYLSVCLYTSVCSYSVHLRSA